MEVYLTTLKWGETKMIPVKIKWWNSSEVYLKNWDMLIETACRRVCCGSLFERPHQLSLAGNSQIEAHSSFPRGPFLGVLPAVHTEVREQVSVWEAQLIRTKSKNMLWLVFAAVDLRCLYVSGCESWGSFGPCGIVLTYDDLTSKCNFSNHKLKDSEQEREWLGYIAQR